MLKERLITVLNEVIEILPNCQTYGGICDVLGYFEEINTISTEERNYIDSFLLRNKPSYKNQYKKFTDNNYWTNIIGKYYYWWNPMFEYHETIQIRIDYLKMVISNIK